MDDTYVSLDQLQQSHQLSRITIICINLMDTEGYEKQLQD